METYTYKQLLEELQKLTPEQLNQTATVRDIHEDEQAAVAYRVSKD